MEPNAIDSLLYSRNTSHKEEHADRYIDHYLEQYRIYLHIFNASNDRRNKYNEFFLGLNTAIIGVIGYLETKGGAIEGSAIFFFAPFVGIAICYSWYRIIESYRNINRAKFKVIHNIERKLPIALFETEWELLEKGKNSKKYYPLSLIEKKIPLIFILLYLAIFITNIPTETTFNLFK